MSALTDKHKSFTAMADRWEVCEDFAEGEHTVHAAREKYLPRLQQETDDAYKLRLQMTPVFGAFWRTVVGLQGMLFRKPPQVEVPATVGALFEDIDLAGGTMLGLAQEVVEHALIVGRVGLLVDYPTAPEGITRADATVLKLRPMISLYEAKSIYNWRETRENGVTTLAQVRLIEEAELLDAEDEFKVKTEKRYRVLDLVDGQYRQRLWRVDEAGEEVQVGDDIFPKMGGAPMNFIPFVFIGVDCIGPDVDAPPLVDLATTCLHHYLQATSYERGCFFSGLPTMFISGMEDSDGEISIGGPVANALGNPNSKAYYVEVTSKFEALRQNLEDKKAEMAVLGARMLSASRPGVEAAETLARRQSGEEAVLANMAQTVSQGLTKALQWMADWLGAAGEVKYELNRDFLPTGMTAQDLSALVSAWQSGAISQESLFAQLKQGEVIDDDTTFEVEQERINSAQAQFAAGQEPLPPEQPPPEQPPPALEGGQTGVVDLSALEAAIAALTEQHQTILDQVLQAIASIKSEPVQNVQASHAEPPDTGMQDMMKAMGGQHAEAMAAMTAAMAVPAAAPIVNVEAQPAPVINIAPAAVNVAAPVINMPEQPITINLPEQQPSPVTVNTGQGAKTVSVQRDAAGKITGAVVSET